MSCAQLVAEYAATDPTCEVVGSYPPRRFCPHCGEEGSTNENIAHAWNCFWARCVRHEQPTVTVR